MSEAAAATRRVEVAGVTLPRFDVEGLIAWALAFALVVVLAFSGGGYESVVRGQVGLVVWSTVLVGALCGTVTLRSRPGLAGIAMLGGFAGWVVLGLGWTESQERTWTEVARVATLLGVLVLGVAAQRRTSARSVVDGVACAVVLVAGAAVLSRLRPDLVGSDELAEALPNARNRLAYPLGYWNLLGGFAVMGVPLLLAAAAHARTTAMRALAAGALPLLALCAFLTVSRGTLGAVAVVLVAFFVLAPNRLPKLAIGVVAGAGGAILCVAADRREALQDNLQTALAREQADELGLLTLLVVAGVTLVAAAIALVDRHATRPGWSRPGRRTTGIAAAVAVAVGAVVGLGAGVGDDVGDQWREFKNPQLVQNAEDDGVSRLKTINGNGRYQYWEAMRDAQREEPLTGIGPGAFEYYWARNSTLDAGFVRDGHSLWAETLGESGMVGLVLLMGFFVLVLVWGAVRALRAEDDAQRVAIAGATAAVAGFAAVATIDWAWEMTVLPAAAMLLAAVALAGRGERRLVVGEPTAAVVPLPAWRTRLPFAATAVAALVVVGLPTIAASDLRDSQRAAAGGDLRSALERARSAASTQRSLASAHVQQALVLERLGELRPAIDAARRATDREPTNWRTWTVLSRLQARDGQAAAAVRSYERARSLNPRSPLFAR